MSEFAGFFFATPAHANRYDLVARERNLAFLLILAVELRCRGEGKRGGSIHKIRSGIAGCTHAAHRARTRDRGLARRPRRSRGELLT
jgi:hypothetical protein